MELPDFMSYSDKFSNGDFLNKVQRIAKRAGSKLVYGSLLLYYTIQSDKVSRTDKAIIIGALGYLISPLDMMPDAIPIVGLADDMAVLVYVLKKVWSLISDEARENAKNKMKLWFDEDEMQDVDNILNDKEQYTEG
ncbi:YkvA family protein [Prevotella koreensis]